MQKSFEGLLRSVLFQILKQQPKLQEILNPVLEEVRLPYRGFDWGLQELERSLRLIIKQTDFPLQMILFFDALDEYDGQPEFIGQFLQDLIHVAESTSTRLHESGPEEIGR